MSQPPSGARPHPAWPLATPSTRRRAPLVPVLAPMLLAMLAACGGGGGGGGSESVGGGEPPSGSGGSAVAAVVPTSGVWISPSSGYAPSDLHPSYTIQNTSGDTLSWTVQLGKSWLSVAGASSGAIAAGGTATVTIDIDVEAATPSGSTPAVGHITFVDASTDDPFADRTVTVEPAAASAGDWSTFAPSGDTKTVYVSASGNDAWDGLSPSTPKKTVAAGVALLRHGYPDWLLLRRGDTFNEGLGQWKKSGRSEDEPMLVSTYGSSPNRPLLRTGNQIAFRTEGGGGSPPNIDHLAVVGLHFFANGYAGNGAQPGINLLLPSVDILFEDCMVQGYSTNVVFQGFGGRHADVRLRRSVIVDAWAIHGQGTHPQGLYAYAVDGLLIEENVFDHNGWNEGVANAGADQFSHNLYIDNDNTGVVVRGNVIAQASSHGMQLRPGGVAVDNLFVRNSIALSVGGGNNPEPAGVDAQVHQNVFLDGKNIDAANQRGWALWLGNVASGHASGNIIAHNTLGTAPRALIVEGNCHGDTQPCIGVHGLTLEDNVVYDWGGNLLLSGSGAQITDLTLDGNDLQDFTHSDPLVEHTNANTVAGVTSGHNAFYSELQSASVWAVVGLSFQPIGTWMGAVGDVGSATLQVEYLDPTRTLAGYNALQGGSASLGGFLGEARKQSATNWRMEYTAAAANAWVREGFTVVGP